MRYSVHPSRAFRNRIAKSIGVLVAAALVATLGLPGAAQAQSIDPTVAFSDGVGFTVEWEASRLAPADNWIVSLTRPDGTKVAIDRTSDGFPIDGTTEGIANEGSTPGLTVSGTLDATASTGVIVTYGRSDVGTWWVQTDACYVEWGEDEDDTRTADVDESESSCPDDQLITGDSVGYTHGAFPMPMNFAASIVPGGVALTWSPVDDDDQGFENYQYRMDEGDEEGEWKKTNPDGALVVSGVDPGDYTFMLRVLGVSDNDLNTKESEVGGMVASSDITVPVPTPTLPEIAALFLAMLLLGSGAYLLRRRQSGGLTHA